MTSTVCISADGIEAMGSTTTEGPSPKRASEEGEKTGEGVKGMVDVGDTEAGAANIINSQLNS